MLITIVKAVCAKERRMKHPFATSHWKTDALPFAGKLEFIMCNSYLGR